MGFFVEMCLKSLSLQEHVISLKDRQEQSCDIGPTFLIINALFSYNTDGCLEPAVTVTS